MPALSTGVCAGTCQGILARRPVRHSQGSAWFVNRAVPCMTAARHKGGASLQRDTVRLSAADRSLRNASMLVGQAAPAGECWLQQAHGHHHFADCLYCAVSRIFFPHLFQQVDVVSRPAFSRELRAGTRVLYGSM